MYTYNVIIIRLNCCIRFHQIFELSGLRLESVNPIQQWPYNLILSVYITKKNERPSSYFLWTSALHDENCLTHAIRGSKIQFKDWLYYICLPGSPAIELTLNVPRMYTLLHCTVPYFHKSTNSILMLILNQRQA